MLAKDEFRPTKNVKIATLPIITKEFTLRFEMKASSFTGDLHSLFHMTIRDNHGKYGDRIPGVWTHGARIMISSAVNNEHSYEKFIDIVKDKWISFEVSQRHERTGEYVYELLMNGAEVVRTINERPTNFENVMVYASDPWNPSFNGSIRNMEVCIAGKCPSLVYRFIDSINENDQISIVMNIFLHQIYLDDLEVCVTITTGTEGNSDGTLKVTMNDEIAANGQYGHGEVVIDTCFNSFNSLKTLTLSNPSNDAWTGKIVITEGGRPTLIECNGCIGAAYWSNINFDGNSDSSGHSSTHCFNGDTCSITWSIRGTYLTLRHILITLIMFHF